MAASVEEQFEEIADDAVRRAESVLCSFDDFVEGLRTMHEIVRDRYYDARNEQREKE